MFDFAETLKKRMKWRRPPEITDLAYEISRLKHEAVELVLRLDDLEKAAQSKSELSSKDNSSP